MNLQLDHVASLTELLTPLSIGVIIGLLALALIVFAFTHRWWGLALGIVVLLAALGAGAYLGLQVKDNLSPAASTQVLEKNSVKVQAWAKTKYDLTFTDKQAKTLAAGTESFIPGNGDGQFGTVNNVTVQQITGSIVAPVTLFYADDAWNLGYPNPSGKGYVKVPVKNAG